MPDLIRHLITWAALLLKPRSSQHHPTRPPLTAPLTPPRPTAAAPLPPHRSPYGLDTPLDATATRPVRPYLAAHEQRQRRRELALAALGQDPAGPYWIHGLEVA